MLGYCLISAVEMKSEVGKARFLASLRNDSGGRECGLGPIGNDEISRFARNDSGGGSMGLALSGTARVSVHQGVGVDDSVSGAHAE